MALLPRAGHDTQTATQRRRENIWRVVRHIPTGCVATYGQVAELAGLPRGARQVGAALKAVPADMDLPWHRVINAQGRLSLPTGSRAWKTQKSRLQEEGVVFANGRVNLSKYGWQHPLDALLWGPS